MTKALSTRLQKLALKQSWNYMDAFRKSVRVEKLIKDLADYNKCSISEAGDFYYVESNKLKGQE